MLPEGVFKIPERAMGIWGKSTTINQNFVHIFFLILVTSKHFSIYPITLHLYMDEYTLLKKYLDSLCLAGVFIIKLTVTKTLYPLANIIIFLSFRRKKFYKNFPFCQLLYLLHLFVSYFLYSSEIIRGLLKNPGSTRGSTPRVGSTRGFGNPRVGDFQIPGLVWGFSFTNPLGDFRSQIP